MIKIGNYASFCHVRFCLIRVSDQFNMRNFDCYRTLQLIVIGKIDKPVYSLIQNLVDSIATNLLGMFEEFAGRQVKKHLERRDSFRIIFILISCCVWIVH